MDFFSFFHFSNTHVKLYHTNANVRWYIVVTRLCSLVHGTIKAEEARKTEFDFQQPRVVVMKIWRST